MIDHKETVAFSGFTAAGAAKAVPMAIADRAKQIHAKGDEYWLRVINFILPKHMLNRLLQNTRQESTWFFI